MHLDLLRYALGLLSGVVVGLSVGLIGGGSVLAVPLTVYLVGVPNPHPAPAPSPWPPTGASNRTYTVFAPSLRGAEHLTKTWSTVAG